MPRYRVTHAVEVSAIVVADNEDEAQSVAFDIGEGPGADVKGVDLVSIEMLSPEPSDPSTKENDR